MEHSRKNSDSQFPYREKPDVEDTTKKRKLSIIPVWPTRRKTLQSYITITLGLGHMLRFAAALAVYGGIMLIPYFACAIFVGIPLITVEIALAHYVNKDIKFFWEMLPIGKGVFYNCFIATFMAAAFSNVYLTYSVHLSITYHTNVLALRALEKESVAEFYTAIPIKSVEKEYGHLYNISSSYKCPLLRDGTDSTVYATGEQEWFSFLYLGLVIFVILGISCLGVRSLEKFTTFLVFITYLCAVVLLILTLTLPRSVKYIERSMYLNWSKLKEFSVWLRSFEHVIKGFAIGTLCFTFVSIHSDFHDDIMVDVVIVFLTDFLSTLLLSFIVLGLLGTYNYKAILPTEGLPVHDYLAILGCIVHGLRNLPPPTDFWAFLFFMYLTLSVIGTQSFMVASVADAVMAMYKKFRANTFLVTAGLCLTFYVLGCVIILCKVERLPFLDGSFLAIGFLQSLTLFWIYNYQKVCADFHFLMGYKPSLFYQFTWVISPVVFAAIIVIDISTQKSVDIIVNNTLMLEILHVLIYFLCGLIEAFNLWRKGKNYNIFKNNPLWGPSDPLLKKSRIIFKSRIITKEHIYRQKLYKKQLVKPYDITDQNIVQLQ